MLKVELFSPLDIVLQLDPKIDKVLKSCASMDILLSLVQSTNSTGSKEWLESRNLLS